MRLRSTMPATVDEEGFACTVALVECRPEERPRLERLLDEFHPVLDIFSLRDRPPNLVELGIQLESARRHDADALLRFRLHRLLKTRLEGTLQPHSKTPPACSADSPGSQP